MKYKKHAIFKQTSCRSLKVNLLGLNITISNKFASRTQLPTDDERQKEAI